MKKELNFLGALIGGFVGLPQNIHNFFGVQGDHRERLGDPDVPGSIADRAHDLRQGNAKLLLVGRAVKYRAFLEGDGGPDICQENLFHRSARSSVACLLHVSGRFYVFIIMQRTKQALFAKCMT
jgi:hypothetical protein